MKQILCCGYIALDLISYKGRLVRRAGGTAGNVAANLAFLGWQAQVGGVIGNDAAGRALTTDLRRAGVNADELIGRPDSGTPLVVHEINENGHRFWFHCPECGRKFPRYRPLDDTQAEELSERTQPDVFFFDRASAAMALLAERLRERGTTIVFEPSTQGRDPERCAQAAHIVKYSTERAPSVEPLLRNATPRVRIVTDGERGVRAYMEQEELREQSFPAHVVDAGGAGDWTTAAFLWRFLDGVRPSWSQSSLGDALRGAQAIAAVSCAYAGARAVSEHLTRDQLLAAARTLVEERVPATAEARLLRRPRPRATGCPACLSPA
jgi:fructokinase